MKKPEMPEPWEEIKPLLSPEEQVQLEELAGSGLTEKDLSDEDYANNDRRDGPQSLKARLVHMHKWLKLRNRETNDNIILRLQKTNSAEWHVSSVIVPFEHDRQVSGTLLRSIPTAAIAAAYTAQEIGGTINMNRAIALGEAIKEDPTKPLPKGRVTDSGFLARIGRQYEALSERQPDADVVQLMAEINGTSLPNVKKWLAAARKNMLLMPVASGRRRG